MIFHSPTFGELSLPDVRKTILDFMSKSAEAQYRLVIGTDSQPKNGEGIDFVTAIVVQRVGMGGIYFWRRKIEQRSMPLRNRIYMEAMLSLNCADEVLSIFKNDGISKYELEIHVDIGEYGETKEMIGEIVGMIHGSGFAVKTKPESYGASKVADRHT